MKSAEMILIGQLEHRRTHLMQAALHRRDLPPARIIDYAALLTDPQRLSGSLTHDVAIKLDSPGESAALHDALLHHGWVCSGEHGDPPAPLAHGELAHQQLWYIGFADLLSALDRVAGDVRWLNPPDDVLLMCDKWRCQQDLAAAGIAIPELLGTLGSYEALRQLSKDSDCDRLFVKARYGSSAAGVLAYCRHRDGREVVYASTALVDNADGYRLFNTLTPQRFTENRKISALIDTLALQGAYAERWIAKPRAHGQPGYHFDLRVVAFNGEPRQRVARISDRPMTNLHLGNRRGDPDTMLNTAHITAVEACVRTAAAVFPRSANIGFDLIPGRNRCHVLEANAFGDLLPGLQWHGADAWDDQAAWVTRLQQGCRSAA